MGGSRIRNPVHHRRFGNVRVGESLTAIAERLNVVGHRLHGGEFHPVAVYRILSHSASHRKEGVCLRTPKRLGRTKGRGRRQNTVGRPLRRNCYSVGISPGDSVIGSIAKQVWGRYFSIVVLMPSASAKSEKTCPHAGCFVSGRPGHHLTMR